METYPRVQRAAGRELWGGADTVRHITSNANWRKPIAWNKAALEAGVRDRVFAFSLSDVFEERADLDGPRHRFFELVDQTPNLDWLVLTKRPWAALAFFAGASGAGYEANRYGPLLPNLWLGTTAGTQKTAKRISHLLDCRPFAARLFTSVEPMLEAIDLRAIPDHRGGTIDALTPTFRPLANDDDGVEGFTTSLDWVICGGESGSGARPFDIAWARSIRDQCATTQVPFFFKQGGANAVVAVNDGLVRIKTRHRKAGDLLELPNDLRIRQFPVSNYPTRSRFP